MKVSISLVVCVPDGKREDLIKKIENTNEFDFRGKNNLLPLTLKTFILPIFSFGKCFLLNRKVTKSKSTPTPEWVGAPSSPDVTSGLTDVGEAKRSVISLTAISAPPTKGK